MRSAVRNSDVKASVLVRALAPSLWLHQSTAAVQVPRPLLVVLTTAQLWWLAVPCTKSTHTRGGVRPSVRPSVRQRLLNWFGGYLGPKLQGESLSPLLFKLASEYAIRKDRKWMEHIGSWSVLMMLIYWVKY